METKDGIINIMSDGIAKYDYSTPEREYTKEDWDKVDEMEAEMNIEYNPLKKAFDDYMNKYMKIIHEIKFDPKDGLKVTFYGKGIRDLALGNK